MNWQIAVAILAVTLPVCATVIIGLRTANDARTTRESTEKRTDKTDVLALITNDRDYWRAEAARERARADELQALNYSLKVDADHVADVAQAALLGWQVEKRTREEAAQP